MKMIFTTLAILSLFTNVFAQSAVVAAGGSSSTAGGSVSYSVGQIAYESYGNNNFQISEGVQQVFTINILGCMSANACNFNAQATIDDGGCVYVGDACDDNNAGTTGDSISVDCTCMGVVISVNENDITGLLLYPNPTSQQLRIESSGNQIINRIEIKDLGGKSVMSDSPLNENATLNVASLAAGQYIVEITTVHATKRVQIQILR